MALNTQNMSPDELNNYYSTRNTVRDKFRESISTPEGMAAYDKSVANTWKNIQDGTNGYTKESGFDHFMGGLTTGIVDNIPAIYMGLLTAGAGSSFGAAAGAGEAAAGGAAASAGGAAAGSAAGSGATGALTSVFGDLAPYVAKAGTSMALQGGSNLIQGKSLTDGVLKAGLMSGVGQYAGSVGGGFVGDGLKSLGMTPDMVKSLTTPITTGAISTGTSLLQGNGLGQSLTNGLQSGAISYGSTEINNYLKSLDLSKPVTDIMGGAGKGVLSSTIKGKNPLTGLVSGAIGGAAGVASGAASSLYNNLTTPTGGKNMSTDNEDYSYEDPNSPDWLKGLYTNLNDPKGVANSTDFTNYGQQLPGIDDPTYNVGDAEAPTTPDYLAGMTPSDYGTGSDGMTDQSNTGNAALTAWLKQQGLNMVGGGAAGAAGGIRTALPVGATPGAPNATKIPESGTSFIDKLMKQLGGVGTAAGNNPLAAIAAAIGGVGAIRNATGHAPSDLGKVTDLMNQGSTQMNSAPTQSRGQIAARDPRFFTQQYAPNGEPVAPTPAVGALTRFGG